MPSARGRPFNAAWMCRRFDLTDMVGSFVTPAHIKVHGERAVNHFFSARMESYTGTERGSVFRATTG